MDCSKIADIPLFASLERAQMECIATSLRQVDLRENTVLFNEGQKGDRLYIIMEGQLEVIKALGKSEETLLTVLGPGNYMGEISLLDPEGMRTATVRSRTAARLAELTRTDFDLLLQRYPNIAYQIAIGLSVHLRNTNNATIRDLQQKNEELLKAYEDLQSAHLQIVEKEKLEHELKVAREIQQSILPQTLPCLAGFDFGARMLPARAVGGDFFDLILLDRDSVGIAIGDVSDKGVPAAIFMAVTRSLVRAEARNSLPPRQVLENVNHHLLDMNSADMFVTVLYGVVSRKSNTFTYARAGHELPVVISDEGSLVTVSKAFGQALGLFEGPALDEQVLTLEPGDTLLVYTDGVSDATAKEGERFGVQRLQQVFATCHNDSAQAVCDCVLNAAMAFQEGTAQHDDLAVVAVKALHA